MKLASLLLLCRTDVGIWAVNATSEGTLDRRWYAEDHPQGLQLSTWLYLNTDNYSTGNAATLCTFESLHFDHIFVIFNATLGTTADGKDYQRFVDTAHKSGVLI